MALVAGIATIFAWLAFASASAGRQCHRRRSLQVSGVVSFPAIVAVKLTNPLHGLYFSTSVATEPFVHTVSYHGPHWFVTGFSYAAAGRRVPLAFRAVRPGSLAVGPRETLPVAPQPGSRRTSLYALGFITAVLLIACGLSPYSALLVHINYEPLGVAAFALAPCFMPEPSSRDTALPGNRHWSTGSRTGDSCSTIRVS